ncbi:RNA polymerase sigma factor [Iningainema tapete]|uniref:Sigma-70 family RNA polymerase sigma factor n=1 Tax=Iningainema tapete BLCC-T55 TaxID=2748662 RepID=A0A8J7CA97_9CYAN|nr:sigma-70 family RNA polymerase sigma factor [Iningainema tapete]MBD2771300.1 sigma-70 family RNA polymerase sigma factor [Iningainema tapete BLCC-T55]
MMLNSRELGSNGHSKHITEEQQKELLTRAKEAAASGEPGKMLEFLHRSFVLDGLTRRIALKWRSLSRDEVDDIVAKAVDILYEAIRDGKKVSKLVPYLLKTCEHKACDYYRTRQNEKPVTPDDLEHIADQSSELEDDFDRSTKELDWEEKRSRAIAIARSLIPRLGQHNVQKVMNYILDALSVDCVDISNAEIAEALGLSLDVVRQSKHRGFQRLERIVREEGLAAQMSDVVNLKRDCSEQLDEDEHELV